MRRHYDEAALQEFLDGRGDQQDQLVLRAHLETCIACASRYRGLRLVERGLRLVLLERPAHDLTSAVMGRIRREHVRTWLDVALDPRVLTAVVVGAFGSVVAAAMGLMALHAPGTPAPGSDVFPSGIGERIGGVIDSGTAFLTRSIHQVLGPEALQITVALVIVVPLFILADRLLTVRRIPG
jgi:hypothetical protein